MLAKLITLRWICNSSSSSYIRVPIEARRTIHRRLKLTKMRCLGWGLQMMLWMIEVTIMAQNRSLKKLLPSKGPLSPKYTSNGVWFLLICRLVPIIEHLFWLTSRIKAMKFFQVQNILSDVLIYSDFRCWVVVYEEVCIIKKGCKAWDLGENLSVQLILVLQILGFMCRNIVDFLREVRSCLKWNVSIINALRRLCRGPSTMNSTLLGKWHGTRDW